MKKYFFILFFIFFTVASSLFSQNTRADSLLNALKSTEHDTERVNVLNKLAREYQLVGDYENGITYAEQAKALAGKIIMPDGSRCYTNGIAAAYNNFGNIYWEQGNYDMALENHLATLRLREKTGDKKGAAYSYNNIGLVYWNQGNYDKALENYFSCLRMMEEIGDKKSMAASYNNIGNVYADQAERQLNIDSTTGDYKLNIEIQREKYEKALENHFNSLRIRKEIDDKKGIAASYNNIGIIYDQQGNYDKALENYFASLKIKEEIGDKQGIAASCMNIGTLYTTQKKFNNANEYLRKSLAIATEIGHKEWIKESYKGLSDLESIQGSWKEAYEYHKFYSEMKDTILNEESSRQIAEMQTKYETEKKEQQISLLNKDKELQDAQLNRQRIIIWSVAGGLLIVLILSIFIFRERRKSEKLLLNILPVETARELKKNGKATAKHYESVTVMFTDFKGFTTIAEKLSAEELVSELDFLFKKFDEIISKYNIEKIKTIGDAYMCASGLPTPNTNHAEEIVKAGIEIQSWMKAQNNKWSLRMGIHTGPVTAGVVGDKKFAYDIWGDTVNTASRMESSGEPNKINISGATHELIRDKFNCEFRGRIPAKNKGEIEMYFVEMLS